jgi:ABC-2 type transport system permease protein
VNVFLREVRAYRRSTIIWAASLSAGMIVFMTLWPAFANDLAAVQKVFAQFPDALKTALNITPDIFFTINGFYGYLLTFVILSASIQAMNLGTGVISKEVAGKTADFLLSKPITRSRVVSAKLAAALTSIVITDVVFWAVSYTAALIASKTPFDAATFFLMSLTVLLVQMMFMALGALFAVSLPKIKSVISVTLPTVFSFYIIGIVGELLSNDSLRYLSLFKFYNTTYIIRNVSLDSTFLLVEAAFLTVVVALSYLIYIKKDIQAST